MDPFRIACPHCSSKIIVRHEAMLGQTLPCPKCKGAIAIPVIAPTPTTPSPTVSATAVSNANATVARPISASKPQSAARAAAPIIDSTAMTKVGDFDWNEILEKEELSTRPESDGQTGSRFKQANEPDFIPLPSTFKPIAPTPVTASSTPINKQALQRNAKRRQMITLASIGFAGSLLAVGGFVAFMLMVGTKDRQLSDISSVEKTTPEQKKQNDVVEKPNESSSPVSTNPSLDKHGPDKINEVVAVAPSNEVPSNSPDPFTNAGTQPVVKPAVTPTANEAVTPPPGSNVIAGGGAVKNDEEILSSAWGSSIPQELVDIPMASLSLRDNDFADLDIENADVSRDQLFHPSPSPIPSWEKNSRFSFPSLRVEGIRLLRCIDMFGRMSGVGVTVDWQSCRVAGIDLTKKCDFNVANKSIAELMEQLLKENGLVWTLDPSGLPVVSATKEAMESKLPTDWSVVGLFSADAEKQACEDLLRLWGYDDVCRLIDGRLQWTEQATPIEKANLASSLCQLARLRHQETGNWSQVPDASLIFSPGQWNGSFPCFERLINRNIVAPERRPIAEVLMLAADKLELNLVIDWQSVWGHGLTPNESAYVVLGGRKFPQVAKRFLNDFALELMPIGDDAVLLTTRDVRRSLLRIVPLRLPKNYKVEDLKQSLRELAPVVDDVSKFRVIPVAGTEDLFFARICNPRVDQLNDPDLMLGLGWPDR